MNRRQSPCRQLQTGQLSERFTGPDATPDSRSSSSLVRRQQATRRAPSPASDWQQLFVSTRAAVPASQQRQLNVPLDTSLIDALKKRASEEGITLSRLVQQLLNAAMEGWTAAPNTQMRLNDHEQRLSRLENHPLLRTPQARDTAPERPA